MANDISYYMVNDLHKPLVPKPLLQKFDNYQIYSLIFCDYSHRKRGIDRVMVSFASDGYSFGNGFSYTTGEELNNPPPTNIGVLKLAINMIAYQRFSINPIPINFDSIAAKLSFKPHDTRIYKYVSETGLNNSEEDVDDNNQYDLQKVENIEARRRFLYSQLELHSRDTTLSAHQMMHQLSFRNKKSI